LSQPLIPELIRGLLGADTISKEDVRNLPEEISERITKITSLVVKHANAKVPNGDVVIKFSNILLGDENFKELITSNNAYSGGLSGFYFSRVAIRDESLKFLCQYQSENVTELDLSDNFITSAGAKILGDNLGNFINLTNLNLSNNEIDAEGIEYLINSLNNLFESDRYVEFLRTSSQVSMPVDLTNNKIESKEKEDELNNLIYFKYIPKLLLDLKKKGIKEVSLGIFINKDSTDRYAASVSYSAFLENAESLGYTSDYVADHFGAIEPLGYTPEYAAFLHYESSYLGREYEYEKFCKHVESSANRQQQEERPPSSSPKQPEAQFPRDNEGGSRSPS
jgi:hypothetical protein